MARNQLLVGRTLRSIDMSACSCKNTKVREDLTLGVMPISMLGSGRATASIKVGTRAAMMLSAGNCMLLDCISSFRKLDGA